MEESTMLHIMEQKQEHGQEETQSAVVTREEEEEHHRQEQHWRVGGEGRRPLPVPRPNQVIQEHTSHHQVKKKHRARQLAYLN